MEAAGSNTGDLSCKETWRRNVWQFACLRSFEVFFAGVAPKVLGFTTRLNGFRFAVALSGRQAG
jgi:hypothetical protein